MSCQTAASGLALGVETAQLNGMLTYPPTGTTANQLETFELIGMFDAPLPGSPAALPALSTDASASLDWRARSCLHAYRINSTSTGTGMPPIGKKVRDSAGRTLIESWIDAMSSCPQ